MIDAAKTAFIVLALSLAAPASAFAQAAPPTAGFPPSQAAPAQPAPPPAPPAQPAPPPAPPAQPAAVPQPPPPPSGPPPPVYSQPPPAYGQPPPPPPPAYGSQPAIVEPPPPLPPKPEKKGLLWPPPWSIRIDPFTWIFNGQLNFELEVGLLKWLSLELVPQFVTSETPPLTNGWSGWDNAVKQASNGWGPLSGTSIGAGFWLQGKPLQGYVLRAIYENYAYKYSTSVEAFPHTARVLMAMFGSNSTIGAFTIAGGIGFGVDLNSETHCYTQGCGGIQLALRPPPVGVNWVWATSGIYPAVIAARISFGVTFK